MTPRGKGALLALLLAAASPFAARPAAAQACPAEALDATTTPATRRGPVVHFRDRLADLDRSLRSERYDVLMLGDSHVQQWPRAAAERAFGPGRILNAGLNGDRSAALLHRLESRRTLVNLDGRRVELGVGGWETQRPRLVFLLVGGNDTLRDRPACAVAAGIEAVLRRVTALYPEARVVFSGLLPRGPRVELFRDEAAEVNRLLPAVAERAGRNVTYADLGAALRCDAGEPCDLTRPPNHGHLTAEGYRRVADALRSAIGGPDR